MSDNRRSLGEQLNKIFPDKGSNTGSVAVNPMDGEKFLRRGGKLPMSRPVQAQATPTSRPANPGIPRPGTSSLMSGTLSNPPRIPQEAAVEISRQVASPVQNISDDEIRELDENELNVRQIHDESDDDDDDNDYAEGHDHGDFEDDEEYDSADSMGDVGDDNDDADDDNGYDYDATDELGDNDDDDDVIEAVASEVDYNDDASDYSEAEDNNDDEDDGFDGEAEDDPRTPREVQNALLDGMAEYYWKQVELLDNPLLYGLGTYDDVRRMVHDLNSVATAVKDTLVKAGVEVPYTAYPGFSRVRSELPDNKVVFTSTSREPISHLIIGLVYFAKQHFALRAEVEGYRGMSTAFGEAADAKDGEIEELRAKLASVEERNAALTAEVEELRAANTALAETPNNDSDFTEDRVIQLPESLFVLVNSKVKNGPRFVGTNSPEELEKWNNGDKKISLKTLIRVDSLAEALKTSDPEQAIITLKRIHKYAAKYAGTPNWFKNPLNVVAADIILYNQVPDSYDPKNPFDGE